MTTCLSVDYATLKTYRKVFGPRARVFYAEPHLEGWQSFDVVVIPANYGIHFKFSDKEKPKTFGKDFPRAVRVSKIG